MKIRDNETGQVFDYGTNRHHALRISEDGSCLTFENLQNGDGSCGGGYSFVLDDGKTPEESDSPDAVNGATYANIGGFGNPDIEKILQNIEKQKKICLEIDNGDEFNAGALDMANSIKDIIKKHLFCENHTETTRQSRDDGWIPCSERMPDKYGKYIATIVPESGDLWKKIIITNFSDLMGIIKKPIFYTGEVGKNNFENITKIVTAWQPLPKPYKPPVESAEEKSMREREEFFKDGEQI